MSRVVRGVRHSLALAEWQVWGEVRTHPPTTHRAQHSAPAHEHVAPAHMSRERASGPWAADGLYQCVYALDTAEGSHAQTVPARLVGKPPANPKTQSPQRSLLHTCTLEPRELLVVAKDTAESIPSFALESQR